jgi:hypothetical protein
MEAKCFCGFFVPLFFQKSYATEESENWEHTANTFLSRTKAVTLYEKWQYA